MSKTVILPRIGVYNVKAKTSQVGRGFSLWAPGYAASLAAAGAEAVDLRLAPGKSWDEVLDDVDGVVFAEGLLTGARQQAEAEQLCEWCREQNLPFLGIDQGLLTLNSTYGGTIHLDVSREVPEALQHRQPPEPGARHAIAVTGGTRLAEFYGEGEIVVNSEHRRAVNRVARGFRVCARALDGLVEAIEADSDGWFALGVQWHPASVSASGLDIQVFRGLVEACGRRQQRRARPAQPVAA